MELHLFVIWEKGRHFERQIEEDIRKNFSILQIVDIQWDKTLAARNFTRFYGVNLPVGINKLEQCGSGEFRMIVVQDPQPKYDIRNTSHGNESVNIHMFDAKSKYRQWIGGPSRVHATNNPNEFNHDLTLLFGINATDYKQKLGQLKPHEKFQRDVVGAHGWESINQLFYVLNNTINYVILRGSDGLEKKIFSDRHRDCDLLVDNATNAQLIINGTTLTGPIRPHESVTINDYTYYLDLWGSSRYYFDIQWCNDMLATKILRKGYYVLNETNNFYCLLYHCLITKGRFSDDYLPFLENYQKAHIKDFQGYPELLVDFLQQHLYEIVHFEGNGAGFHTDNPIISRYYNKYGKVLGKSCCIQKDLGTGKNLEWKSCVYDTGDKIIKEGSDWLIRNEIRFLQKLATSGVVPKILDIKEEEGRALFYMEKIAGTSLNDFFSSKKNYNQRTIKNIASQIVNILKLLKDNNIIHRDLTGNNLLIDSHEKVYVIDFGWAINTTNGNSFPRPQMLTSRYRPPEMYSDFYTIGAVLTEISDHHLPYLHRLGAKLREIQWHDYFESTSYDTKIKAIDKATKSFFSFSDHFHCFLYRHRRVSRYYYKIKRKILK